MRASRIWSLAGIGMLAVMIAGLPTRGRNAPGDAIELLTPPTRKATVKECAVAIAGKIKDPAIKSVTLFRDARIARVFPVLTLDQRRSFVNDVSTFWKEDMVATSLHAVAYTFQSDSIVDNYSWDIGAGQTLQTFWTTQAGKDLIKHVNDAQVRAVRMIVAGGVRNEAIISETATDRWLNTSATLMIGDNVLELMGRDANNAIVLSDTLRLYYLVDVFADAPGSGFSKYTFHGSETEKECRVCHPQKPISNRDACEPCHDGYMMQRFTHTPAKRHQCGACHDSASPTLSVKKSLGSDAELCYSCHEKQKAAWSADSLNRHAPVDAGSCLQCHTPHGSPNVFHTVAPINKMCSSCHEKKDEFSHPVVGHPHQGVAEGARPGREMSCAGCHNPHASKFGKMLRYGEGMEGCTPCHDK